MKVNVVVEPDLEEEYVEIHVRQVTDYMEGIVFWRDEEPRCKIKRSDFGFKWNEAKVQKKYFFGTK